MSSNTWTPIAIFLLVAVALTFWALTRDRQRRRAVEAVGVSMGMRYEPRGAGVQEALGAVPSLQAPGRHAFAHALIGADEIIVDWRIVAKPKERRRDRVQTLYAFRRPGLDAAPIREEVRDPERPELGEIVLEAAGEWVVGHAPGDRTPADEMATTRDRMRGLTERFDPTERAGS